MTKKETGYEKTRWGEKEFSKGFREKAEGFYAVHSAQPFFEELTQFMSSGPCIPVVLEKESAVVDFRNLIGATDPSKADAGKLGRVST